MSKVKNKQWEPSLAFLTDLLSIINLKSIKLGCGNKVKKEAYESEAEEIVNSINSKQVKIRNIGNFIRAIQIGQLTNEFIWANETKARLGGREQDHLLPLTHTLNGLRMRAGNKIIEQTGGRKDLNLDRMNDEFCKKYGFDFEGVLK